MFLSKLNWVQILHWCYQLQGVPFKQGPSDILPSASKENWLLSGQINLLPLTATFKTTYMHTQGYITVLVLANAHPRVPAATNDVKLFRKLVCRISHNGVYVLHDPKSSHAITCSQGFLISACCWPPVLAVTRALLLGEQHKHSKKKFKITKYLLIRCPKAASQFVQNSLFLVFRDGYWELLSYLYQWEK